MMKIIVHKRWQYSCCHLLLCSSLIMKLSLIETVAFSNDPHVDTLWLTIASVDNFVAASATVFGHFGWYKVAQGEHIHCRSPFLLWSDCFTDYHLLEQSFVRALKTSMIKYTNSSWSILTKILWKHARAVNRRKPRPAMGISDCKSCDYLLVLRDSMQIYNLQGTMCTKCNLQCKTCVGKCTWDYLPTILGGCMQIYLQVTTMHAL